MLRKLFSTCQGWLAHPTTVSSARSLALEYRGGLHSNWGTILQRLTARLPIFSSSALPPEIFFYKFFNASADGFFMVNSALQFVEVNDSLCRMWGLSRKEFLTQTLPEALAGADCDPEFFSDLLARTAGRGELTLKPANHATRILELQTSVLPRGFFMGSARDVTVRKERERELGRAAEWRALLLRSLNSGLGLIDVEGQVLLCNRAFETAFGLSAQLRHRVSFLKPSWQTPQRECLWALCNLEGVPILGAQNPFYCAAQLQQRVSECRLRVLPCDKICLIDAASLHDEHNNLLGVVITVRDISSQYRHEQEALQQRQIAEQSARFAAQRTLAREVVPMVEEPSSGIALYAQMLLHHLPAESEEAVLTRGIVQETQGLLEVIRELRALAQASTGKGDDVKLQAPRPLAMPTLDLSESQAWPFAVN